MSVGLGHRGFVVPEIQAAGFEATGVYESESVGWSVSA